MSKRVVLTKENKIAVIQRGMARLPAMGDEAKWAFGAQVVPEFSLPPPWVRRVVLLSFGDLDRREETQTELRSVAPCHHLNADEAASSAAEKLGNLFCRA